VEEIIFSTKVKSDLSKNLISKQSTLVEGRKLKRPYFPIINLSSNNILPPSNQTLLPYFVLINKVDLQG